MGKILSKLLTWFKKAWSIIVIVSVVFGFYTYFHEKKPDVKFTINGDANVFDIYKSVSDLEIFFLGKNIEKENLNLKIYNISVENDGESDILKNLYDDNLPWGFSVENGDIVSDPRIVKSSSQYLDSYLNPKVRDNRIEFDKVIFEHKKYFMLEFLVLHKKSDSPKIVPFGKIAGVDNFKVLIDSEQERRTIVSQLLDGGIMIHALRLIIYTIISIIILMLFVFIVDRIDKIKIKRKESKRGKIFQEYLNSEPILNPEVALFLSDIYIKSGSHGLKRIRKKLKNEKLFIMELERKMKEKDWHSLSNSSKIIYQNYPLWDYYDSELLLKLIKTEDKNKIIDPSLKIELNKIIPYLSNINQKKK